MPQPFGGKLVIGFLIRRIFQAAIVVLIVTVFVFILLRARRPAATELKDLSETAA